jgi:hypothetical protein
MKQIYQDSRSTDQEKFYYKKAIGRVTTSSVLEESARLIRTSVMGHDPESVSSSTVS